MRRSLVFFLFGLGAATTVAAGLGAAAARGSPERSEGRLHGGAAYFAVFCGFSHRNQDDPIVFPRQPGRSHDHTYFGNTSTDASSTPSSLRAAGRTTCRLDEDTAAYWAPTLFANGRAVEPLGLVAYYVRRTFEPVRAFPAGLKVIAGSAAARRPQSRQITVWSCGRRSGVAPSSEVPTCPTAGVSTLRRGRVQSSLRLQVNFPSCWDGRRLDSADHQSHMAYAAEGECPASHPVEVPGLTLVAYYAIAGGSAVELASGGQFSAHMDFVNAWHQPTLEALVDRYLNGFGARGGHRGRR
jgi:hypothetical protein